MTPDGPGYVRHAPRPLGEAQDEGGTMYIGVGTLLVIIIILLLILVF
jgi:hypothetical protein